MTWTSGRAGVAGVTALAPVSWGTTYVVVTELLPDGRPLLVAAARVVPAGLVLLLVAGVRGGGRALRPPRGRDLGRTSLLAVADFGLFFPLLAVAVYRLPGGVAAAAGGLQPVLVALLSWPVGGRRPRAVDLGVGAVAATGVALVVLRPGAALDGVGVLAAVAANVAFATGVVLTKRFPAPADRVAATGWQLLLAGALLVPLAVGVEGAPPVPTAPHLAGYAYLSVVATGLAFVAWFAGVRRLPAAAPPLLGLAAPITGATLGRVLLGESMAPLQIVGLAVTLAAIAHGARLGARSQAPAARAASDAQPGPHRAVVGHHLGHDLGRHDGDTPVDQDVVGLAVRPVGRVGAAPHGPPPAPAGHRLDAPPPHVHVAHERGRLVGAGQRGPQCGAEPPDGVLEQGQVGAEHGERCALDLDDRPHQRPPARVARQLRGQRHDAGRPHRQA
jgi:probable blue pigment (indigoidine) exporter